MGCGASKDASATVVPTNISKGPAPIVKATSPLSTEKTVLPSIKSKAIAFEIPLDDLAASSSHTLKDQGTISSSKQSLPKMSISDQDIRAKLANAEERWKALDQEAHSKSIKRKKGDKPVLTSSLKDDPKILKQKLQEKEAQAALNRQKEKEKLAAKIAAQEERAKKVLQRKKEMEQNSSEDEENRMSWGGEKEEGSSERSTTSDSQDRPSRNGSGKSSGTDTTDVVEDDESADAPSSKVSSEEASPEIVKKKVVPVAIRGGRATRT